MANHAHATGSARGEGARTPLQVPLRGWKDVLWRVKDEMSRDNITVVAGGVAFFSLLALFPAIAAMVALYGLVASPQDVADQMQSLSAMLPPQAQGIVQQQMNSLSQSSPQALGWGAIFSIGFALWSASKGTRSIVSALNIAYNERDERGIIKSTLLNLGLTLGGIVLVLLTLLLVAVVPAVLGMIDLGPVWDLALRLSRWPILFVIVMGALALLYRLGPDRKPPRWQWASPGAIIATLLWLAGSIAFSLYVTKFGSYNETYGAIAGVVVLMMWLYLTAMVVLLGAEINSELERQTRRDTTTPPRMPLGDRGAYSADTLPHALKDEDRGKDRA